MDDAENERRGPHPLQAVLLGAASGAAGTTALDRRRTATWHCAVAAPATCPQKSFAA